MQIKDNLRKNLQNPWLISVIKLILLAGCCCFLYLKWIQYDLDFSQVEFPEDFQAVLISVFVLMLLNWALEIYRWKISIEPVEQISYLNASSAILAGLALNWILPFTSGDLTARIAERRDKYQAASAAFVNRGIMFFLTFALGAFGISKITINVEINFWWIFILFFILFALLGLMKGYLAKFLAYAKNIRSIFGKLLGVSLIRYLVFVFQFFLLLNLFLPELSILLLIGGIGWIFFIRSVLPTLLGGVGVREVSGLLFFEPYIERVELVLIPIFFIWIINTVIPSLVGFYFVWKLKLVTADS